MSCTGWQGVLAEILVPCQAEQECWQGEKDGKVPKSQKSPGQFV